MAGSAPRGRPAATTREAVIDVATRLVLDEGFDAVSARRLAAELGISAFTAHRYAGSMDALMDEVVDRLLSARKVDARRFRTYRAALHAFGTEMLRLLTEHPTVVHVLQRAVNAPEPALVGLDRIADLGALEGISLEQAAGDYETVWHFVLGAGATLHARDDAADLQARVDTVTRIEERHPGAAAIIRATSAKSRQARVEAQLDHLVALLSSSRTP